MAEISTTGLGEWWERASKSERDRFERQVYDTLNMAFRLWGPRAADIIVRDIDTPATNESELADRRVALMAHRVQFWEHGLEVIR